MEIFGIGPLELLFIVLIALIVLGPKDMMNSAQKAATWIKKLRQSEIWTSTKEVMDIPKQVLHESGLDKEIQELQNISQKGINGTAWQPGSLSSANSTIKKAEQLPEDQNSTEQPAKGLPAAVSDVDEQPPQDDK
jgi:Sec-independent protein translocase protein TatA